MRQPKLTTRNLYEFHRFAHDLIDKRAQVPEETTSNMMHGIAVSRENALKVLLCLSELYGKKYDLDTVKVVLKNNEQEDM